MPPILTSFQQLCARIVLAVVVLLAAPSAIAHEWLLFGERHLFVSLVSEFREPRHYRVVLHVQLPYSQQQEVLKRVRRGAVVTFRSEDVDLRRLVPGNADFLKTLGGRLAAERRGRSPTALSLKVRQTLIFSELDIHEIPPPVLSYTAFGAGREWYVAKVLNGPPDFDQLLRLPRLPTESQIHTGRANQPDSARGALRNAALLYQACIAPCAGRP